MAKFDLSISVYNIEEAELATIRNAVLRAAAVTTDVSLMIEERTEVNAGSADPSHPELPRL